MAEGQNQPQTNKRDLTLALSAMGAIFAGLVGTNVLDTSTSAHYMVWLDHGAVLLWVPALLLVALCAYKAPANEWLNISAWIAAGVAGVVTAGVLLLTGFGFTRDTDHVRLLLTSGGLHSLQALCGPNVDASNIDGTLRTKTLREEFVIFDFEKRLKTGCRNSVDIPRADVLGIQEDPSTASGN